jgi:SAM-dependent methyltransferase
MKSIHDFYLVPNVSEEDRTLGEIIKFLLPRPAGKLLDIGCFDGAKTLIYSKAVQANEIWGVDFLEDKLEQAKKRGIHTLWADLNTGTAIDLPDMAFDVIICSEVIEHIYSPDDLLDNIARLLKPDGYALLTTPNLASWKNRIALLVGWQPFLTEISTRGRYGNPLSAQGRPSGHIRIFTLGALKEMVWVAGMKPAQIRGLALSSPQRNLAGVLSRFGDLLLTPLPAFADRLLMRLEKNEP